MVLQIDCLREDGRVTFVDGCWVTADTILYCTGYHLTILMLLVIIYDRFNKCYCVRDLIDMNIKATSYILHIYKNVGIMMIILQIILDY